LTFDALRHLN